MLESGFGSVMVIQSEKAKVAGGGAAAESRPGAGTLSPQHRHYRDRRPAPAARRQGGGRRRRRSRRVGGGAFGNEEYWILESMQKAIEKFKNVPLNIKIVSYGRSNLNLKKYFEEI